MNARTIRRWSWVHKWTSLICTLFILSLCVSGLPLIFRDEIDGLLYTSVAPASVPSGTPAANLDAIAAAALSQHHEEAVQFLIWDSDDKNVVRVAVGKSIEAAPSKNIVVRVDEHSAAVLDQPDITAHATNILLRLHAEMFAGMPGRIFVGVMGLLFLIAVVSGVVLYAPSMRKLDFGTVRRHGSSQLHWLDLHNLLGILTVSWALVVGVTGVINASSDIVQGAWRRDQLAAMTGPYKDAPIPAHPVPVQNVVEVAARVLPQMTPLLVAYPGTAFTSRAHYVVFMHGERALTSRLLKIVMVNGTTGEMTGAFDPPWYVSALRLSQPLHFGDYGGLPLKIIWGFFDAVTIIVLGSGAYLWLRRAWRLDRSSKIAVVPRPAS
jgi:uncharacterized iron-regulated membrane protein